MVTQDACVTLTGEGHAPVVRPPLPDDDPPDEDELEDDELDDELLDDEPPDPPEEDPLEEDPPEDDPLEDDPPEDDELEDEEPDEDELDEELLGDEPRDVGGPEPPQAASIVISISEVAIDDHGWCRSGYVRPFIRSRISCKVLVVATSTDAWCPPCFLAPDNTRVAAVISVRGL